MVAATIEQGGFGAEAAAPAARQILDAYFNVHKQEAKAAGGKVPSQGSIQAGLPTGGAAGTPTDGLRRRIRARFDERSAERGRARRASWASTRCSLLAALGLIGFSIFTLGGDRRGTTSRATPTST